MQPPAAPRQPLVRTRAAQPPRIPARPQSRVHAGVGGHHRGVRRPRSSGAARLFATCSTAATRAPSIRCNPRGGVFFGIEAYTVHGRPARGARPGAHGRGRPPGQGRARGVRRSAGVRAVVVLAAGFSETGAEGASLEREILDIAARYRMTLVGPNCIGLMSNVAAFHATGFVNAPSAQGAAQLHHPVGQPGRRRRLHLRTSGHRPGEVHQRGQRSPGQRLRRARLPARRPRHQGHHAVPGGHRRRAALLRRRAPHHADQAGHRAAGRPHRVGRQGGCVAHRAPWPVPRRCTRRPRARRAS